MDSKTYLIVTSEERRSLAMLLRESASVVSSGIILNLWLPVSNYKEQGALRLFSEEKINIQ